jgi:phosphoglucosamine mutase
MKLALDCANGAASRLAPELFRRLGAEVIATGNEPDGRNINLDCGALHLDSLRRRVLAEGADAGIAFDGDADRCMMVSATGRTIDGDAMLLLAADSFLRKDKLRDSNGELTIVATVMSNFGLEAALKQRGVQLVRAAVGDKYVLEEMIRRGAHIGGEQSGHVIFRDYATTGDGMLTALRVLETVRESGQSLDALTEDLKVYPQILVNVRIKEKRPIGEMASVQDEIDAAITDFGGAGRVVVRFSGTEPLARVMVEGPDDTRVQHFARRIARALESELGSAK